MYGSLDEAKRKFYVYRQSDDDSNAKHLQNFKNIVDVIEHFGGDIFQDKALIEHEREKYGNPIDEYDIQEHERFLEKKVRDKMMAVAFLRRANTKRYDNLILRIRDQFAFGQDVYPKKLTAAYELLENHSQSRRGRSDNKTEERGGGQGRNRGGNRNRNNYRGGGGVYTDESGNITGMQFAQNSAPVAGTDGRMVAHITCFKCYKKGHYSDFCPEVTTGVQQSNIEATDTTTTATNIEGTEVVTGVTQHINATEIEETGSDDDSVIISFQCHQANSISKNLAACDDNSILIDTGSTCSVFKNDKMLMNIRKSPKTLRAFTNGGHQDSTQVADLPGFFQVWYNRNSMVNILTWADVRKHFRITADTAEENAIHVHVDDGKIIKFEKRSGQDYISSRIITLLKSQLVVILF